MVIQAPVSPVKPKSVIQNYLTYDEGNWIRPSKVNVDALPKFFKKGMERKVGNDKLLIEKTEVSAIIDECK